MPEFHPSLKQALRHAGQLCQQVQRDNLGSASKHSDIKQSSEPVTAADYGSQAIIGRALHTHYPDDGVLSEESAAQFTTLLSDEQQAYVVSLVGSILGQAVTHQQVCDWLDSGVGVTSSRQWTLDPIDGTRGFVAQRQYVNALGLLVDAQPVGALIGAPVWGEHGTLFCAVDGVATMQPLYDADATPVSLHVSQQPLASYRWLRSVHQSSSAKRMRDVCQHLGLPTEPYASYDSMLKYCLIASGEGELYMRLPFADQPMVNGSWDHAPGAAIVLAAGGRISDASGRPLDFSEGAWMRGPGMVATNGVAHDAVIEATHAVITPAGG